MASFTIWLDKRGPKNKKNEYNLTVRACLENKTRYLNIIKMTEKHYHLVFEKKSMDTESIEFREKCNSYITKCERVYEDLKPFSYERFRERFYDAEKEMPSTLKVKDLFDRYIEKRNLKLRTKQHMNHSATTWCKLKDDLTVWDITPELLEQFEKSKLEKGVSLSSINSYHRDIRAVLKYFLTNEKLIPANFVFPFGGGGYSIKSGFPKKAVLSMAEIQKVLSYEDFDTKEQRYARDIWAFLYYCNGINFVDLLRMRWDNREGNYLLFTRKKTETTRKNHIQKVCAPVTKELQDLLDILGDKTSPFILGELNEGYGEATFENKCHKLKQRFNKDLTALSKKLELSVPLKLKTARECYATSLKRAKISIEQISEMLNHHNPITSMHYLGSMDMDATDEINSVLVKKTTPEFTPEYG